MCKVYAIAMQKGGVGKTVSTINIAANIAASGKTVLAIDLDPQHNLTYAMNYDADEHEARTVSDLMVDAIDGTVPADLSPYLFPAENFHIMIANDGLADIELQLSELGSVERTQALKRIIDRARNRFDYILIDTRPSLGLLAINSMAAADAVLIPCSTTMFTTEGLLQIYSTIQNMKQYNPALNLEGIFFTKYDRRTKVSTLVADAVREYGEYWHIYDTVIPYRADADNSIQQRKSLLRYSRHGDLSRQYTALTQEIMAGSAAHG